MEGLLEEPLGWNPDPRGGMQILGAKEKQSVSKYP